MAKDGSTGHTGWHNGRHGKRMVAAAMWIDRGFTAAVPGGIKEARREPGKKFMSL